MWVHVHTRAMGASTVSLCLMVDLQRAGSADGMVRMWERDEGKQMFDVPGMVYLLSNFYI